MTTPVKVSVILPVLNEEDRLPSCLAHLQRQTLQHGFWELLIIDNGSTDGSLAIANKFANCHSWQSNSQLTTVKVFQELTPDVYIARNLGVSHSIGEFVVFTDSHCVVTENWLNKLTRTMTDETGIVIGQLAVSPESTLALKLYNRYYRTKTRMIFEHKIECCYYGHGANMVIRRRLFEQLGTFKTLPIAGDTEYLHRLLASRIDNSLHYEPDAIVKLQSVFTFTQMLFKLRKYGRYTQALEQVANFRALNWRERLLAYRLCIRGLNPLHSGYLALLLMIGVAHFTLGRNNLAVNVVTEPATRD